MHRGSEILKSKLYVKILAVGIFILLIGIASASSVSINIIKTSSDSNYTKTTTQTGESEIINRESIGVTTLDGTVEVVDQQQYSNCGWGVSVRTRYWEAQSFIPTLETLTKIKVKISKTAYWTPSDINITLHIRTSLTGEDLVNLTQEVGPIRDNWLEYEIPLSRYYLVFYTKWLEYDFPDLTVIPGNKYYIILESDAGTIDKHYLWVFQRNNGYNDGEAWSSNDSGVTWTLDENLPSWEGLDCCFITYGFEKAPRKPIILGPRIVLSKEPPTYRFLSTDPEGNNVSYFIKWGDDNVTEWGDYQVAGEFYSESYKWAKIGKYVIEAKAKDIYGAESEWSNITVRVLRPRVRFGFIDIFPIMKRLLALLG